MHRRASHEPQQGKRVDDPDSVHITAHQVQSQPSHQVPVRSDNVLVLVQLFIQGSARNLVAQSLRCNRQSVPHDALDSLTLCKHRASRPCTDSKMNRKGYGVNISSYSDPFGRKSAEHRPNDFRQHCLQVPNVQSAALDRNTPTETQTLKWGRGAGETGTARRALSI